jgi:hypothetical protein
VSEKLENEGCQATSARLSTILPELHALVDEILFGAAKWPPDPQTVRKRLIALGLEECLPGDPNSTRSTRLGRAAHVDLFSVFLGEFDAAEIPMVLRQYGLFSLDESNQLWDRLEEGENVWPWLKWRLQLAYRTHFKQVVPS